MKKALHLSVPSKAFIAGEYSALMQMTSILVNFGPRFELKAVNKPSQQRVFHPESLAGKLETENLALLQGWQLEFIDPFNGAGGFGRSSAEFAMLYAFLNFELNHKKLQSEADEEFSFSALKKFKFLSNKNEGMPPSGADVMSQLCGGVTLFKPLQKKLIKLNWPFQGLGFLIFATGLKQPTHSHLESLNPEAIQKFAAQVENILASLEDSILNKNEEYFLSNLKMFSIALRENQFVCQETLQILQSMDDNNRANDQEVLASKGCGALGADMILIIFDKKMTTHSDLKDKIKKMFENRSNKMRFVASELDISNGLKIEAIDD
jgi:mevalonate kinase